VVIAYLISAALFFAGVVGWRLTARRARRYRWLRRVHSMLPDTHQRTEHVPCEPSGGTDAGVP
jgi:hypothetical protein